MISLGDKAYLDQIFAILKPKHFFNTKYRSVFMAIHALWAAEKKIDIVNVIDEASKAIYSIKNEKIDLFILHIIDDFQSSPRIDLAYRLKEIYLCRCFDIAMRHFSDHISKDPAQLGLKIEQLRSHLMKLEAQIDNQEAEESRGSHILDSFKESYDKRQNKEYQNAIKTGFRQLDGTLGGLNKSDLILLAARPGMGKTSFALNLVLRTIKQRKKVYFFSLEMSKMQLMERLLATNGGLNSFKIRQGTEDVERLAASCKNLQEFADFLTIDDSTFGMEDIKSRLTQSDAELIVIDYLQLMRGDGHDRIAQITAISRELKLLARHLEVPVLALSQLNRQIESRKSKIPQMSDLRDSGSLEQDADSIIFIYREEYYNEHTDDKELAEIIVSKNRHGPTGSIYFNFKAASSRFREINYKIE